VSCIARGCHPSRSSTPFAHRSNRSASSRYRCRATPRRCFAARRSKPRMPPFAAMSRWPSRRAPPVPRP
jgi:hypothetical protein